MLLMRGGFRQLAYRLIAATVLQKGEFMFFESDEEIALLVERFENCRVSAAEWTHAAHLTAALWYVARFDLPQAIDRMRTGIFRLNEAHGTPDTETRGYHETLTVFWTRSVAAFWLKANEEKQLAEIANELIASCGDSSLPLRFYSRELLFSPAARARFVEPDKQSFEQQKSC